MQEGNTLTARNQGVTSVLQRFFIGVKEGPSTKPG